MKRFLITEAFFLNSLGKLLLQGTYYATEDEAQIAELKKFEAQGSCDEQVSKPKEAAKVATETAPEDDLSTVKGLGKAALEKLAEKQIVKKSELAAALADKAREEEMKGLLGKQYAKVLEQFVSA